ncbi:MAG: sulfotransferase, partial [Deltaproteobacteria bacterium]
HKRRARDRLDYREYYTEETAELIAQRFKKDIEMLGYSFDG